MKYSIALSTLLGLVSVCAFAGDKRSSGGQLGTQPVNNQQRVRDPIPLYETFDRKGPSDLGVRGDILYMVYNVPALTYASKQDSVADVFNSDILGVPGKLGVGCDLALMYDMPNQPGYSFEAGWYHIIAKLSAHASGDDILLAHSLSLNNAAVGSTSTNAHMSINFFDLLIKKQFAFGDWFSVTPVAGLIGGFMNGKSRASATAVSGTFTRGSDVTSASLNYTSKFEGIGMKLGGCSSFRIWKGFRLQAEFFYNVLYGFTRGHLNYVQDAIFVPLAASAAKVEYSQHEARSFFDSLLGLAWENRFSNDTLYLDVHAGWRFQSFSYGWGQFQVQTNNSFRELPLQGQGLQAGVTFKF